MIGVWMIVLIVCWLMFGHYRTKMKCLYCGSEWRKHEDDCPYSGSGC